MRGGEKIKFIMRNSFGCCAFFYARKWQIWYNEGKYIFEIAVME